MKQMCRYLDGGRLLSYDLSFSLTLFEIVFKHPVPSAFPEFFLRVRTSEPRNRDVMRQKTLRIRRRIILRETFGICKH